MSIVTIFPGIDVRVMYLLAFSKGLPFDFWGGYGWFGLGENFFPQTPGDKIFFPDTQQCKIFSPTLFTRRDTFFSVRFFCPGISLQDLFSFEISQTLGPWYHDIEIHIFSHIEFVSIWWQFLVVSPLHVDDAEISGLLFSDFLWFI